ncbi:short chain dehydrogenase [Stagonosporopsis vannaccii]|nr:short chain dehydrogenase [Stagonosporopsis vannaccii]
MQPPFPSPTATWHNNTYDAISPTNPVLSQSGKTVIITGAGSGIGRATAIAFATAGAARLILIGRTEASLQETAGLINTGAKVEIFSASVTDEARLKEVAESVGEWDVLLLNAAHRLTPGPIITASLQDWWQHYETNVKSIVIASQTFIPKAKPGAALYAITAGAYVMPPAYTPGLSSYLSSKVAQSKVMEFVAAENPDLFVCTVHPGMIETDVFRSSGADPQQLPMDDVNLPAHFLVWLSQPKNSFLSGKVVWANWDVEELAARAEEIRGSPIMTIGYAGWPFSPAAAS